MRGGGAVRTTITALHPQCKESRCERPTGRKIHRNTDTERNGGRRPRTPPEAHTLHDDASTTRGAMRMKEQQRLTDAKAKAWQREATGCRRFPQTASWFNEAGKRRIESHDKSREEGQKTRRRTASATRAGPPRYFLWTINLLTATPQTRTKADFVSSCLRSSVFACR
uniref:Uncharacterized protein n=1 Tax=Toxoplasma gondii COUG TaxID=1074873 RepID=A0A2G8YD10_TOXGO|nr:hypothetical protein TGCOUG_391400 [Toxoplasma gondii COUG]